MIQVSASHILVKTESEALDILHKIVAKEISFEDAAKKFSFCPSKKNGGSLGVFGKGMMVKEFEEVCFNDKNKVGDIVGPIKTQFGFHLIKINSRI
ncbi:MAG: peptidylprolyl isomerase [archaeon]